MQSLAPLHALAQTFSMHGPEQHQSAEQLPPGAAQVVFEASAEADRLQSDEGAQYPGLVPTVEQQRVAHSRLDPHDAAQIPPLQSAPSQQSPDVQSPPCSTQSVDSDPAEEGAAPPLE
jgi:hypothetical protein